MFFPAIFPFDSFCVLAQLRTARASSSRMIRYSSPSSGDLVAGILAEQDPCRRPARRAGNNGAVVLLLAVADGDDLALLRLLLGRVGDDDAPDRLLLCLIEPLDEDAIVQWSQTHSVLGPPEDSEC